MYTGADLAKDMPDWLELFTTTFLGASVALSDHETSLALIGFPLVVVSMLWDKYGRHCRNGQSHITPLEWLIFLSYLRTGLSWPLMSLLWRIPMSTLRNLVMDMLTQLDLMVDEVRQGCHFPAKICPPSF